MNKLPPKTAAKPKTTAVVEAVFEFCDRQVAQGIEPTYELVARHFCASNDTVGPFIKAWRETRSIAEQWDLADATQAVFNDAQAAMWSAACRQAQARLLSETHDLKQNLREANAQIKAYEEVNENLNSALESQKALTKQTAEDSLELASQLHEALEKLRESEAAAKELNALQASKQRFENELQKALLQVAKLEGQIEGMRAERGIT